jgi:P4 family phage/plasmid primase-like protien
MSFDKWTKPFITNERSNVNYTKIGNHELNVFGNKYFIPQERVKDFYKQYKKHVFEEKQDAYLTEKQLEKGKILIDLDFRYNVSVNKKQHGVEHIDDFVEMMLNALNVIFENIKEKQIEVFIFEKENVKMCDNMTKDGIHIIVNVLCDFPTKKIIREHIISGLPDIWDDLPIVNTWNDVVDDSVMKGHANWQMYGSKKPGCEPYKLKYMYECTITNEIEVDYQKIDISKVHFDTLFPKLCARDTTNCNECKLHSTFEAQYEEYKKEFDHRKKAPLKRKQVSKCNSLNELKTREDILSMIDELHEDTNTEYKIKEIHAYVMCLPKEYWGPGSYAKWIRVGWALKNTSELLLLTWLYFSSQSDEFDFKYNQPLEYWNDFEAFNKEGLTHKSILFWAKTDNYNEYKKIYGETVDYYIHESFKTNTECDIATTLYSMFKEKYVCANITNNIWYEFKNNRWSQNDSGVSLRHKISTHMYQEYTKRLVQYQSTNQAKQNNIMIQDKTNQVMNTSTDDSFSDYKKKVNDMLCTCKMLKKTTIKNNIMKEAKELFYDSEFHIKLDTNPYLLGCTNGVIDFKEKTFRKGKHDDYISKTTGLTYCPMNHYKKKEQTIMNEINEFMSQLFPNEDDHVSTLRDYMWEHLASTLMGTNENQTFNIYTGSGANGKSKLVELMKEVLNEYQGTVPISLITQKRTNIGGTSSEVHNLIGIRYAVMQEPTKGDKINEGIMKEITGGDEIQCRALFHSSTTFRPQFKLVVCTNTLFDVMSNDDGTWRRLRIVDFRSKFTSTPYEDKQFPKQDYPHQYKIDPKINEKFKSWAPIFLSMLVDVAFKTQGFVTDVKPVVCATNEYRHDQDALTKFHEECFQPNVAGSQIGIKKTLLKNRYKEWCKSQLSSVQNQGEKELYTFFEKKYGKYNGKTGWTAITIRDDDNDVDGENNQFGQ